MPPKTKPAYLSRKRKRAPKAAEGAEGRSKKVHWGAKSSASTRSSNSRAREEEEVGEEEEESVMESGRVGGEESEAGGGGGAAASTRDGESEEDEPDAPPGQICVSATCSGCVVPFFSSFNKA